MPQEYSIEKIELPNGDICNIEPSKKLDKDFSNLPSFPADGVISKDDYVAVNSDGVAYKTTIEQLNKTMSGTIYGFHIDSNESDPSDAVTYLEDAVGMTPAAMNYTTGTFEYGSWGNAFFMPKPCMLKYDGTVDYYLDPDDYSKKEDGVTASDVADDTYDGNAMIEWGQNGKKIWYKIVPDADPTSASVYIADYKADDDFEAWSFVNSQNEYVDHFYTPCYNGWKDGSDRMRSISGKVPTASLNVTTERTYCRNNNTNLEIWDTEVFCDVILINLLLTLMSKSLDSQTAFGQGNTTSGQEGVLNTGTGDSLGMFFGYNTTTSVVKIFGMENWWGNLWRRFGGLVNVLGVAKYKLTRGTRDGSANTDYVVSSSAESYTGYLQAGELSEIGWVTKQLYNKYMFAPYIKNGGSSIYYCDYFYISNPAICYAYRGGSADYSSGCGCWCLSLHDAASSRGWSIAASPSCKPLV